jgi:hypothetical protein
MNFAFPFYITPPITTKLHSNLNRVIRQGVIIEAGAYILCVAFISRKSNANITVDSPSVEINFVPTSQNNRINPSKVLYINTNLLIYF